MNNSKYPTTHGDPYHHNLYRLSFIKLVKHCIDNKSVSGNVIIYKRYTNLPGLSMRHDMQIMILHLSTKNKIVVVSTAKISDFGAPSHLIFNSKESFVYINFYFTFPSCLILWSLVSLIIRAWRSIVVCKGIIMTSDFQKVFFLSSLNG